MQIEEIVKKVLEEIRKLELVRSDLKKMLVIGEAQSCEKELRSRYEGKYEMEFAACFDENAEFDVLLLAEISPNTLQKLAMGMNPRVGPVMEALMGGKEVLYSEEGLLHRKMEKTCPKPLYRLYEDSVKKIGSFGICREDGWARKRSGTVKEQGRKKKGLIGEKEILQMVQNGEKILYTEGAPLITPLARDLMRNHGITAEKRERRE
ncbi:hypothetical protein ACHAL6_03750 [Proteiniclasticum sp. C24MP]|uniref:hypothetical protein n=1 Tax=Proteiniclasticum sp. C24MP TaxID=3374101 RepID=UPI003754AE9C